MKKTGQNINADDFLAAFVAGEAISDGQWVAYNYADKKVYKASASALNYRLNVIGQAVGGVAIGVSCKVNIDPIVYATVTDGTIYYLSNTQGAIATTAGTISREIGIGLGTTRVMGWKNGRRVTNPFSTGGNFTCPVHGYVSYYQSGAYIEINSVGQTMSSSDSGNRHATAHVKPGDVVTFASAGGPSTYGPMITILDI